ncbi:MAG: hypothetical protein KGO83_05560 [Paenibacillaceae bacterium]|nr:hypothetical protein [Paenibacillaceae bacterium]
MCIVLLAILACAQVTPTVFANTPTRTDSKRTNPIPLINPVDLGNSVQRTIASAQSFALIAFLLSPTPQPVKTAVLSGAGAAALAAFVLYHECIKNWEWCKKALSNYGNLEKYINSNEFSRAVTTTTETIKLDKKSVNGIILEAKKQGFIRQVSQIFRTANKGDLLDHLKKFIVSKLSEARRSVERSRPRIK